MTVFALLYKERMTKLLHPTVVVRSLYPSKWCHPKPTSPDNINIYFALSILFINYCLRLVPPLGNTVYL